MIQYTYKYRMASFKMADEISRNVTEHELHFQSSTVLMTTDTNNESIIDTITWITHFLIWFYFLEYAFHSILKLH